MTRRTFRYDKEAGKVVEVTQAASRRSSMHLNMIDCYSKNPTKSPVDGRVIDSRSALRRHNAENNVIDIGNDAAGLRLGVPNLDHGNLRRDLERAYSDLNA